jgi:acyl-CoA synthetase
MEDAGLSRYEIPEFFVALPDMPIMTNGKIRKADLVKQIGDGRILPERARRRGA